MDFPFSGLLKDILAAFGNWPRWKEIGAAPERIDELETRVAELERLLKTHPADACRMCGERAARLSSSFPADKSGVVVEYWLCGACGQMDTRSCKPR